MTVSEPRRRPRLSALTVGAFAAGFLALATASPAQEMRSDDKINSPATPLPADEDPTIRKAVERLARERYLFLKRLHETRDVTLYQQGFVAVYALFPVGRYDSVYILSDDPDATDEGVSHIYRYDHKEGRDKLVYAVRLKSTWKTNKPSTWTYNAPMKNLLQAMKEYHCLPV